MYFVLQYYKRLFPYSQYARWLQYGNVDKNYMANRFENGFISPQSERSELGDFLFLQEL